MLYRTHCCFMVFSCSGLHVPSSRYWMMGVIQLSISASAIVRHSVSNTLRCLNHISMTNLWWLFFLVTDNLDKASTFCFPPSICAPRVLCWTRRCCFAQHGSNVVVEAPSLWTLPWLGRPYPVSHFCTRTRVLPCHRLGLAQRARPHTRPACWSP